MPTFGSDLAQINTIKLKNSFKNCICFELLAGWPANWVQRRSRNNVNYRVRIIYNILFEVLFIFSVPYYFFRMRRRGGWRKGFGERLGRYSTKFKQAISTRDVIWLHAVSVGEANICVQLIKVLQPRLPNLKFVVSTTTTTAMSELRKNLPSDVGRIYYPIDRRAFVRRALATIRPKAVVLVEAEIWPNFLWGLQGRGIPHFLVNARISKKSYSPFKRGYCPRHSQAKVFCAKI